MVKPCSGCTSQPERPGALDVRTISLSAHTDLFELLASGMEQEIQVELAASDVAVNRLLATPGLITHVHSVPEDSVPGGGVIVTASKVTGPQAVIKAVGSVASIYHASTMRFFMDQEARAIRVQLSSEQPIQVDHTWHFAFRDVVALPDGRFTASSVELDAAKMAAAPRVDLDQGRTCVLWCGITAIPAVLIPCLFALIFGPEAYLACAIGLGVAAASLTVCTVHCAFPDTGGGGGRPHGPGVS